METTDLKEEIKEDITVKPLFYVDVDFGTNPGEKTDRLEIFRHGNLSEIV